jgi:hypothetical protein
VQYASRLPQPSRTLVVPLLAAALGAGVATATFAVVNIEDQPSISLPAVESALPVDAVAGVRNDAGPAEGTAQQIIVPALALRGSKAAEAASAPRYDGGPNEGSSAAALARPQPPEAAAASAAPAYHGRPEEGAAARAIGQP